MTNGFFPSRISSPKTDGEMLQGVMGKPFTWTEETHGILLNGKGVAADKAAVPGSPWRSRGLSGGRTGGLLRSIGGRACIRDGPDPDFDSKGTSNHEQMVSTDACTLAVIDENPDKTYRFRFSEIPGFFFGYGGHVYPGEPARWGAWRTRITDAGVWMIHCHILAHMMMGKFHSISL